MNYIALLLLLSGTAMASIPQEFIDLHLICPELKIESSYSTTQNFTGEVVAGYKAKKAFLAKGPATALCKVTVLAKEQGLGLRIFDAYRPVKAVQFFQDWAQKPETNPKIKEIYYPKFTRLELFDQGFISKQSSHSRGCAVDLTLFDLKTGKDLDMGTSFDYFDESSFTNSSKVSGAQKKNRMVLKELMESQGFNNFPQEWWHFSFRPEPFPERNFDFDVE